MTSLSPYVFRQTRPCRYGSVAVAGCTGSDIASCRWWWSKFPSRRTNCRSCRRRHTTSLGHMPTTSSTAQLSMGWVGSRFSVFGGLRLGWDYSKCTKILNGYYYAFKARFDKIWLHQAEDRSSKQIRLLSVKNTNKLMLGWLKVYMRWVLCIFIRYY